MFACIVLVCSLIPSARSVSVCFVDAAFCSWWGCLPPRAPLSVFHGLAGAFRAFICRHPSLRSLYVRLIVPKGSPRLLVLCLCRLSPTWRACIVSRHRGYPFYAMGLSAPSRSPECFSWFCLRCSRGYKQTAVACAAAALVVTAFLCLPLSGR